MAKTKTTPGCSDVMARLHGFSHDGLVALIHDLYLANKDNRVFLHTRFALDGDALEPYKRTIDRRIFPDIFRNAPHHSVSKAKAAISDYKKATGDVTGLVGLMVFYCERAASFSSEVALDDTGYHDALVRMFGRALDAIPGLPGRECIVMLARLNEVWEICEDVGFGVAEDMAGLMVAHARKHGVG